MLEFYANFYEWLHVHPMGWAGLHGVLLMDDSLVKMSFTICEMRFSIDP